MATTRFPNGLTTDAKTEPLGEFTLPDITTAYQFMDDFDVYGDAAALYAIGVTWLISFAGGNRSLETGESNGILHMGTGGAENQFVRLRAPIDGVVDASVTGLTLVETGKEIWFKILVEPMPSQLSATAINAQYVFGLQSGAIGTDPFLSTIPGIYFRADDNDFTVNLVSSSGSQEDIVTVSQFDYTDQVVEFAFYYNGDDRITAYVNGVATGTLVNPVLPSVVINPVISVNNGSATGSDGQDLHVDYFYLALSR